jgi:glycerophosphoryl diester phosphodiesterase
MKPILAACATAIVTLTAAADDGPYSRATILAHRGVYQQYERTGLANETCTASRMLIPTHAYLENTLASMEAAFRYGANVIEFDIHPTRDGEFVVFHDWTVACRTEGKGVTREQTLAYLKSLDIGHGYTADGGKTFPFRGKHVGAMPTWNEVMQAFPRNRFLVNIKSNDAKEGSLIVAYARKHGYEADRLAFSGGDRPVETIRREWPEVRTLSRAQLSSCLFGYIALGWAGSVPAACHRSIIYVPVNYSGFMWGWPEDFLARMRAVDAEVFVFGPRAQGETGMTGLDTIEQLERLPTDFAGGIVTDRIEVIGPALGRAAR